MRKRAAALVKLTALLLVSLVSTSHFNAAAASGHEGTLPENPRPENPGPENSGNASQRVHSVRATVERALPYLERAGEAWIKNRQCVSCHQVPFMLWSLSAADAQGYTIDRSRLKKWAEWSTVVRNFVKPAQKEDQEASSTLAANIDTLNALLLGLPAQTQTEGDGERIPAAWRQLFVEALVKNQQEQGEWKTCGQLHAQIRPPQETTQVTTAWTLLALDSNQLTAERNRRALATLRNANPTSTEWWAVRLLLSEKRQDKNADAFCDALIEKQQPDGGWGWLTSDRSDALATGLAIYALGRHDADQNRPAISKAVTFLIASQSSDGSWQVPGTKKTTRNKPTPTSNYWGTAWAVIGLLESESSDQ